MTEGWAGFRKDPNWFKFVAETEEPGKLVAREATR